MKSMITRSARIAGAAVLFGGLALSGHAADWDKLDSNGWGEAQGESTSEDTTSAAPAEASGGEIGIASGFERLGMEQVRAECYEKVLSEKLSPEEQRQAADLIGNASDAEEVRMAVLDSGETMVGGFSAADVTCPEGMTK